MQDSFADRAHKHTVKNLYSYPLDDHQSSIKLAKNSALIIPDLHANPLLLLQYLLRSKIMSWRKDGKNNWERIVKFYQEPIPNPKHKSASFTLYMKKFSVEFEKLLRQACFDHSHPLLLLGDVLGDRGQNDWYMLLLLHVLKDKKVKYRINFSNHDNETYCWAMVDGFSNTLGAGNIMDGQRVSLIHFNGIYKHSSYLRKKRMRSLYRRSYLPYVTLFAYDYNKQKKQFTITTHAPGSIELVRDIATEFGIKYQTLDDPQHLIWLLDACNTHFQKSLIKNPLFFEEKYCAFPSNPEKEQHYPPLLRAIWGRHYECAEARHPSLTNYTITWICGHLGARSHPQRIINLDTSDLGKRTFGPHYEFEYRKNPSDTCTTGHLCYSTSDAHIIKNVPVNKN